MEEEFMMGFTELRSQPLSSTSSYSHPLPFIFDKSGPLPPIFQEKQPTPTYFCRKATHSQPFSDKKDTLLLIFWQ